MATLTYILAAVVLLGLCIFVHELGHLLGGRLVGIRARIFSIGYGKGILKKEIGGTTYQVTLIPLGGYCAFYGEDPSEERKGEAYEFLSAPPLRRIVPVVMGPLFNLFFGIVLFFVMNMAGYSVETNRVIIPEEFKSGDYVSPAHTAGIVSGDRIVGINDKKIAGFSDIQSAIVFSNGEPVRIKAERAGESKEYTVKPQKFSEKGYYTIGVMPYGERVLVVRVLDSEAAAKAGLEQFDEVKSIDGKAVKSPAEFTDYVRAHADKPLMLKIVRAGRDHDILVTPRSRELLRIKDFVDDRFPAEKRDVTVDKLDLVKTGISRGTVRLNGETVSSIEAFEKKLAGLKGTTVRIENAGGSYRGVVAYERSGFVGIETAIAPEMTDLKYGLAEGFVKSLTDPFDFIVMNLKGMGMLFSGELDVRQNLSGPIRIAKIAGDTAYYRGISAFIVLMAKISIILMVMNLLPIPAVDGSFILFFLFEALVGKPISQKVMERIQFVGVALLIVVGVLVIFNDLSFLPFFQNMFN
ncbi:MAG: RIP metalloprotease RseP [Spirochaetes bacterium]|nr:MAG: RIP metalloprotease RseP [Spirochaetota bacterium]